MNRKPRPDDVSHVRHQLGATNPVPDPASVTAPPPASDILDRDVVTMSAMSAGQARGGGNRSPRRRGPAIAVVGVAAALVAAAVVVSTQSSSPKSSVVAVALTGNGAHTVSLTYAATQQAESAQAQLSVSYDGTTTSATAVADLKTGVGQVNLDFPAPIGPTRLVSTGTTFYLQVPARFQEIATGGKPWVKIDRSTLDNLAGEPVIANALGSSVDPTQALSLLKGVSGPVTTVPGADVLHGATTTHYRAAIDLAKVAADGPAALRSELSKAAAAAKQSVPADLWVDGQGRLRKLTLSYDPSDFGLAGHASAPSDEQPVTATLELWNFGVKVTATPPPADQVGDLGPLQSILGGIAAHRP
jgi:hypothetical protein